MKKKILSLVLAFSLIVPAICILSACGEKQYDIEITTNTSIEHVQEIKFSSSNTKKTTYRNSEDTYIDVICDQGYAPNLVFTVGNLKISKYGDDFVDLFDMVENPDYDPDWQLGKYEDDDVNRIDQYLQVYTGVLYSYTIPTKDLEGKQTVTYSGDTKPAKVRLTFSLNTGVDDEYLIGDYNGLSFVITDHNGKPIQTFTAQSFINFANDYGYIFVDYDKEVTITLKSTRPMNGAPMHALYNVTYLERFEAPEYDEPQMYCSWTYKFPVNYELPLVLQWLHNIFLEEVVD